MVFTLHVSSADFTPALGGALNDCRDANKIGVLHVVGFAGAFVEIGVAGDAVLFRPCAAADRRVVGIGDGRENRTHPFGKTLLCHEAKTTAMDLLRSSPCRTIVHADNDPLFTNESHSYKVSTINLLDPLRIKAHRSILAVSNKPATRVLQ